MIAILARLSAGGAARGFGGLPGLLDGDEPQGERLAVLARNEDRSVDQPALRGLAELGQKIDRLALGVEPASVSPAGADQHVGVLIEHVSHAVGLQIAAIADADLAFDHRYPIERLAPMLIGQLEMAKALARKVEGAVNAPQLVAPLGRPSRLRDRRRVDDPDQTAAACLRRGGGQRFPDQERQPIAASAQALKQRDIGNIGKPDRRRPGGGRAQSSLAQAIGEDQTQQIHGGCDGPRPQEGLRVAGALLERRRSAKPGDDALPILGHK